MNDHTHSDVDSARTDPPNRLQHSGHEEGPEMHTDGAEKATPQSDHDTGGHNAEHGGTPVTVITSVCFVACSGSCWSLPFR